MSLRLKVFLVVGTVLAVLLFLVNQSLSRIIGNDFSDLERQEARNNASRAIDALQNRVDQLSIKLGDWAQWDDTYQYMIDHNEDYVRSNLQNEAFDLLQINMVVLIDLQGNIVYKKEVRNGEEEPLLPGFEAHLREDVMDGTIHSQGIHKEIRVFPEGAVIYTARPVISSDGTAPTDGFIAFGYYFDSRVLADLARVTHLDMSASFFADPAAEGRFADVWPRVSSAQPFFVETPKDERKISAYGLVNDGHGNPTLLLRITMDRDIHEKGQQGIVLLTRFMIGAVVLFSAIIFFLLNHLVLRKLTLLGDQVQKIRKSGDIDVSIFLSGNDEFSRLAERINEMLKALRDVEVRRKESEKRFRTIADSAPVMIWMSDTNKKCTYVNRVWLDFTGRSLIEELGMGWSEKVHPEDMQKDWRIFENAFAERKPFAVEYRMRRFDGVDRWLFMRGIPNMTEDGSFAGYLGSAVDISERKQAEERQQAHTVETERVNRLMVERELKMIELKEKIKELERHVSDQ